VHDVRTDVLRIRHHTSNDTATPLAPAFTRNATFVEQVCNRGRRQSLHCIKAKNLIYGSDLLCRPRNENDSVGRNVLFLPLREYELLLPVVIDEHAPHSAPRSSSLPKAELRQSRFTCKDLD